MNTLPKLLREADPLIHEPARSAHAQRAAREAILNAPRRPTGVARRPIVTSALVVVMLAGIGAGVRFLPRGTADVVAAVRFEVRLAEETPTLGLREVRLPDGGRTIYLHPQPVVTNSDIAQARVVEGDGGSAPGIGITFTADGAAKMLRATREHLNRPMAILLDGEVAMAPTVRSPMSTSATISGSFTRTEVERIVNGIVGR